MINTHGLGLYDEFPGYRLIPESERDEALKDALVVADANVLLSLYRYNQQTRSDLLKVLRELSDRLWIPHQAVREFWRNRASVVSDRSAATKAAITALDRQKRSASDAIRNWERATAVDSVTANKILATIDRAYEDASRVIQDEDPARRESFEVGSVDPVLRELEHLLHGRVGHAMGDEAWKVAVKEGQRRADKMIPPGYRDAEKGDSALPEGPSGDYLVWRQLLDEAKARKKTTFLITNDEKDDWWHKYRNERIGPRQELVAEFANEVGLHFHMLTAADLLRAADVLHVNVDSTSIEDAERVERSVPAEAQWTEEGAVELMDRLSDEGAQQFAVIFRAATNGGLVSRSEVYEMCHFSADRSLRGFTRPARRITRQLQDLGIVSPMVQPALQAVYNGTPEAEAFQIPPELVDHILENYTLDSD